MLLGLFLLNSRAQKRVNPVLKVDMTKEGGRDARQLQMAGSLLRKGCRRGGLHTFGLGRGGALGNLEIGFLPGFSFTLDSVTRLHLQRASHRPPPKHPPQWKCSWVGESWNTGLTPWAIFYAHEKNKLSDSLRSSPFSTNQFRTVGTK